MRVRLRIVAAAAAASLCGAASAQDAIRGAGLYLQLPGVASCVSCHGPDLLANRNGFLRAADNPLALHKALNAVGAMGYLKPVLGDGDVADLAAFLGRVAPLASGESALQAWPLTLDFGTLGLGAVSAAQSVQLRNRGQVALALAPPLLHGEGFMATHDCPAELNPGAACTVWLRYQAVALGAAAGAVSIGNGATPRPLLVALGARVSALPRGVLRWSPDVTTLDFEAAAPGAERSSVLNLVNAGAADAVLANATLIGPQAGSFALAGCAPSSALAMGARCELRVDYRPTGNAGATALLQLRSDSANPGSVTLRAPPLAVATEPAASGGGASGAGWVTLLLLATLAMGLFQSRPRT